MSTLRWRDRTIGRMPRPARISLVVVAALVAGAGAFTTLGGGAKPTPQVSAPSPILPKTETKASDVQVVQHPAGGKLVIVPGGERVRRLFELTGADQGLELATEVPDLGAPA